MNTSHTAVNRPARIADGVEKTSKLTFVATVFVMAFALFVAAACGGEQGSSEPVSETDVSETLLDKSKSKDMAGDTKLKSPKEASKVAENQTPSESEDKETTRASKSSDDKDSDSSKSSTEDSEGGADQGESKEGRNEFRAREPLEVDPDAADDSNLFVLDCREGDLFACDVLFQLSDYGTPEEVLALNCGGAGRSGDFCTEGLRFEPGSTTFDLESEGLENVQQACMHGQMTACDLLFFRSPLNSMVQHFGNTCGDRIEVALPNCRVLIGKEG